jgi:drug/metabolite transporter (DMT)-like permease
MIGVSIMVNGAVAVGHLIGDLLAFGMTSLMAVMMLIIRRQHKTPMLPAACLSALLCPLVVWPFAASLEIGKTDLVKLFLFGTTQFGLGLVFLVVGGRLVSVTLINKLELPLAVAWVWVCLSETPASASLIGGLPPMSGIVAGRETFLRPLDGTTLPSPESAE